ncbi:MAG: hypothetical protein ACXW16_07040, partial [Burkholderiaceae bacterium]
MTVLVGLFAGALLIIGAGSAAIWWMYTTNSGLRFVVLLNSRLDTSVVVRDVAGSLRDGFTAGSLSVTGPTWSIHGTDVAVEPYELRWRQRAFDFERVSAGTVALDWVPSGAPAAPPVSLASPVDLRVRNLNVRELRLGARGETPLVIGDFAASMRVNGDEVLVERGTFQHGPSRVELSGRIDARSPFALRAEAQVTSTVREQGVTAQARASGTLLDAFVEINADSADAR